MRCTFYKRESYDPCHALALMAKRLATSFFDPDGLAPFLTSRLVALDKMPGLRPIGVYETAHQIIAKAILVVTGKDIPSNCAQDNQPESRQWSML